MKRLSLVLAIAALALPQAGQAGWWRTYGGEGYDVGNCVQITSDGNYIITGAPWVLLKVDTSGNVVWSQKYTGFIGKWVEQTPDSGFIVASWNPTLLRADAQGDSLWTRSYGIYSYCVQPTSDDGYIVTGGTNGYGNDEELIIVKTDSQGDSLWSKRYTEPGNNKNVGYFIQETNEGGFVITGFTGYSDEYVYYSKVWIIKIDSEGTKLWSKMYGTADNNTGFCVRQTKDNGYIITGISSGGIYLLKTSSTGDTVWSKAYGVSNQGTGHNIQQTSDGGYIIEGSTETLFNTKSSLAVRDLWLVKTDSLGDTLWTRKYPGGGNEAIGYCVQQTNDAGYITVGELNGNVYLIKTDSLGLLAVKEKPITKQTNTLEVISSFGDHVTLRYSNNTGNFCASIFDVSGRKVDELKASEDSGLIIWGRGNPSGVYFIQVKDSHNNTATVKAVLTH